MRAVLQLFMLAALVAFMSGCNLASSQLTHENLFDRSRVLPIEIQIEPDDWDQLRKQSRDPGKAFMGLQEEPFSWFKGKVSIDGRDYGSVQVRKKGFIGSLDDTFPSLKVKFDQPSDKLPIDGIAVLTLNNNKQDSSLVSQVLAYDMFNASGVQAPRCSFARVTVNGNDLGIYLNVETMGKPFLQRRYGNKDGFLLEGTLCDFHPKALQRLDYKNSKGEEPPAKIVRLGEIVTSSGNEVDLKAIEELVDLEPFLNYWTIESLIGFWDGYTNNQNNYWVYENTKNGKLYFMPWGADGAFMTGGFQGMGPRGPASVYAESMLANRLFHHPDVQPRYLKTLRWTLNNVWKEDELIAKIDGLEKMLTENPHQRQRNVKQAMRQVRKFIQDRRAVIEKELENWPVKVSDRPRRPTYLVPVGKMEGSFKTVWLEKPPKVKDPKGTFNLEYEMNGEGVPLDTLLASIHPTIQAPFGFGPPMPSKPTVDLKLDFLQASDGKPRSLTIRVNRDELQESKGKPLAVQGMFNDSEQNGGQRFGPFGGGGKVFEGTISFSQVSQEPSQPVEGKFSLQLSELRGGFMDRGR
ncbi:MAG: CotH kinase family protein [Pirellulales bacterium]